MTLLLQQIKCYNKNVTWTWVQTYHLSAQKTETGGSQVQSHSGLHSKTLSQGGGGMQTSRSVYHTSLAV